MTTIKDNLEAINRQIKDVAVKSDRNCEDIILIAVSKRKSIEAIQEAIQAGAKHFGENYIQEAIGKIELIGKIDHIDQNNICWHFIGHLQSNKARFAVNYFDYIHTVDTLKLAKEIDKQAKKINKIQKIFLQINIGQENSKSGADPENAVEIATQISKFENISLQGLMGMPPFFDDSKKVRPYFRDMVGIKEKIDACHFQNVCLTHLSMGMSGDYKVAIQEGSTMVRVGTSIFGSRD